MGRNKNNKGIPPHKTVATAKPKTSGKLTSGVAAVKERWLKTTDTQKTGVSKLKPAPIPEVVKPYTVVHSLKAWSQIQLLISHYNDLGKEVSWFTPVIVNDEARTLTIPEIFVPEQEVHGTETDAPDLDAIVGEVIQGGYGLDTIRGWFHLHPNGLGVTPSTQDELQVQEYLEAGYPTLLRGIINEDNDFKLDYYDTEADRVHTNMDHIIDWGGTCEGAGAILAIAQERVTMPKYTTSYLSPNQKYAHKHYAGGAAGYEDDLFDDYWSNPHRGMAVGAGSAQAKPQAKAHELPFELRGSVTNSLRISPLTHRDSTGALAAWCVYTSDVSQLGEEAPVYILEVASDATGAKTRSAQVSDLTLLDVYQQGELSLYIFNLVVKEAGVDDDESLGGMFPDILEGFLEAKHAEAAAKVAARAAAELEELEEVAATRSPDEIEVNGETHTVQ